VSTKRKNIHKYLQHAIQVAHKSKCRYKHGCVAVNNGKVVAVGTNKKIGDPTTGWRKSYIHAEAAAAIAAGPKIFGAHVYVARIDRYGQPALSRPCTKCQRYLKRLGVAKIIWTD